MESRRRTEDMPTDLGLLKWTRLGKPCYPRCLRRGRFPGQTVPKYPGAPQSEAVPV